MIPIIPKCILLSLLFVSNSASLDFLEFVFGPRLGPVTHPEEPKSIQISAAQNIIESEGYPFENHEVTADSGHILNLHRIRSSPKRKSSISKKPIAFFQHGLFAASDTWLFRGSNYSLPFVLADAGYDVWLSNMRGNIYSRKHKTLNSNTDKEYWNFSLQDVAFYDLPAVMDYILNLTNQDKLYYLGHSVGSTVGLILCTMRPEYNSKIKLHLALAPLAYAIHPLTFTHELLTKTAMPLSYTLMMENIYDLFPRRQYFSNMLDMFCRSGSPTQSICISMIFTFVGPNHAQFNTSDINRMFTYFPSGTSVKLLRHVVQMYSSGTFSDYDYNDLEKNVEIYNSSVPPSFNISKITSPVSLHYGDGDYLVTKEDVDYLGQQLPKAIGKFVVPIKDFNHLDFIWGIDAKKMLYERLVILMNKYRFVH